METETLEQKSPEEEEGEEEEEEGGEEEEEAKVGSVMGGDGDRSKKRGTTNPRKEGQKRGKESMEKTLESNKIDGNDDGKKKKRRKSGGGSDDKVASSSSSPPHPPMERPVRERKSVERFGVSTSDKDSPLRSRTLAKALSIKKGSGMELKEIPNVAFRLSKRKADDNLQILHNILFGKKSKKLHLKRNISQFSGFVWDGDEEKQRAKVKDKIEKCVKEKLFDFCELLDIPVSKATSKKEVVAAKLLEFLESPHATREVLLAEQEQSRKEKKRKRASKAAARGGSSIKRQRKNRSEKVKTEDVDEPASSAEASEKEEQETKDEEEEAMSEESEHVEGQSEEEDEQKVKSPNEQVKGLGTKTKGKTSAKKSSAMKLSKKESKPVVKEGVSSDHDDEDEEEEKSNHSDSASGEGEDEENEIVESKKVSNKTFKKGKTTNVEKGTVGKSVKSPAKKKHENTSSKSKSKSKGPSVTKDIAKKGKQSQSPSAQEKKTMKKLTGKGKAAQKPKVEPSREQMLDAVTEMLKEVDFNTATLSDILHQLAKHFNTDLSHRKAEVKSIIEEAINNMSDYEEEEDDENAGAAEGGTSDDE